MDKAKVILNTIVFKEQLDRGVQQAALIQEAKKLGISNLEIRHEFLKDGDTELKVIFDRAKTEKVQLFYSINDDFIVEGKLNPLLSQYIDESQNYRLKFLN